MANKKGKMEILPLVKYSELIIALAVLVLLRLEVL